MYKRQFQGPADEADVVGRAAAAAGLTHEDSRVVQVIFTRQQGVHDLSDDNEGRVTGVVIYILESHVHGVAVVVLQYFNLISKGADSRLQQVKMNGRHLWLSLIHI